MYKVNHSNSLSARSGSPSEETTARAATAWSLASENISLAFTKPHTWLCLDCLMWKMDGGPRAPRRRQPDCGSGHPCSPATREERRGRGRGAGIIPAPLGEEPPSPDPRFHGRCLPRLGTALNVRARWSTVLSGRRPTREKERILAPSDSLLVSTGSAIFGLGLINGCLPF